MTKLGMVVTLLVPAVALAQPKAPAGAGSAAPAKAPAGAGSAAPAKVPAQPPAGGAPATGAAKVAPPVMPAAPPEVKATVDAFKGNWRFDTTMSATGMPGMDKPFTAKMTFSCKEVAGKTAVSCDAKQKTPMGPFDALFVVSYDPYSKAVHFMGITNMNEVHDHVCKWSGADLNCTPLKGGMGPGGDEVVEDVKMTFAPADKCKPKDAANPLASCPYKSVTFTSVSKMKSGATMTFEGKGKK